jgi:hypothetical protein
VKKIAILGALIVAGVLAAGPVLASNTGFKLNYPCIAGSNPMSFPFFYYPDGNINNAVQKAKLGACVDLNTGGCVTKGITEYRAATPGGPETLPFIQSCVGLGDFDLTPGKGYLVNMTGVCTADIVGSHDDNYSVGKGSTSVPLYPGNNLRSIPYHVKATKAKGDHVTPGSGLCTDSELFPTPAGAPGLQAVVDIRTTGPFIQSCTGLGDFDLIAGKAYFLQPKPTLSAIQYNTY